MSRKKVSVFKFLACMFCAILIVSSEILAQGAVNIVVDVDKTIRSYEHFYNGIGMGSFNDGFLLPYNRNFFKLLANTNRRKKLFYYVIGKGMFMDKPSKPRRDDGGHVYQRDEFGNVTYYWYIVDTALDKVLGNGLKPIISLTFMPQDLASDTQRRNPWNKGIISPPSDYRKWRELIYQTVKHLRERYGSSEIRTWYFEVWNEPDLFKFFWIPHPDQRRFHKRAHFEEYCKLYDYTVDGALAADSTIRIGGPALAGDRLFLEKFLEHCLYGKNYATGRMGTRVDFISRHHYGRIEERILPRFEAFIDKAKEVAGKSFDNFEILITETGPNTAKKPWLNTRYAAAWIVKEVAGFLHLLDTKGEDYIPDVMCFWTQPVPINFSNHFGLVTVLGKKWRTPPDAIVKRPAFNGCEVLGYLGSERIKLTGVHFGDDIHGIATKNKDSSIAILLYHLREDDETNADTTLNTIHLKIRNLPFQQFNLFHYRVDENHSNGYSAWKTIGSPTRPTAEEVAYLQGKDDLELFEPVSLNYADNGVFDMNLRIQCNSVVLLILAKEGM